MSKVPTPKEARDAAIGIELNKIPEFADKDQFVSDTIPTETKDGLGSVTKPKVEIDVKGTPPNQIKDIAVFKSTSEMNDLLNAKKITKDFHFTQFAVIDEIINEDDFDDLADFVKTVTLDLGKEGNVAVHIFELKKVFV
jgi:hypothetical protein